MRPRRSGGWRRRRRRELGARSEAKPREWRRAPLAHGGRLVRSAVRTRRAGAPHLKYPRDQAPADGHGQPCSPLSGVGAEGEGTWRASLLKGTLTCAFLTLVWGGLVRVFSCTTRRSASTRSATSSAAAASRPRTVPPTWPGYRWLSSGSPGTTTTTRSHVRVPRPSPPSPPRARPRGPLHPRTRAGRASLAGGAGEPRAPASEGRARSGVMAVETPSGRHCAGGL